MLNRVCLVALLMASSAMVLAQKAAPAAGRGAQDAPQARTDRMVRFKQIDKNGDGKLSLKEFQMRPNSATPTVSPTPVDAATLASRTERFKLVDKNKDGFLTFEEFKSLETIPANGQGNPLTSNQGR